jgi:hypothetical protein
MAERTKYLTQATLFAPAANKWASDTGILNNNGGLLVLKASNNLSDIADTVNARINLGLRIGSDVQPYSERLTAYANGSAPSAFSLTAMGKTTALEWRDFIGAGTVTSVTVSGGSTGLLFTNGTTTGSGTSTLGGVLAITHGGTGVSNLSALRSVLGVSNVDNTADLSKPISDATQTALNNKFDKPLGSISQYIRGDGTLAAFPTLESSSGTVTSVTLSGGTTGLSFTNGTITNSGTATLTGTLSLSNGGTGVTTVTALRTLLSINNVNNTSDVNKPVSIAQQTALDRRVLIPASFSSGATLELPTPEAGKVLGWNAQGTALINTDGGTGGGVDPGAVYVTVDVFDSDGVNRNFVMSRDPQSIDHTSVTIGGVSQTPGLDYTLSGSTITLTTPAPEDEKIVIRAFSVFVIGELDASQISTDVFTGSIIPDDANAQIALQALETALSLVQTSLSQKVSSPAGMSDLVLPTPEAGKAIGWNPSATSLINLDPGSGVGDGTAVSYADIFTGDGTSVNFTLSFIPNTLDDVSVSVGGVDQIPVESYTITGVNTLTFSEPVPDDIRIVVRYIKAVIIDELTASAIGTTDFTGSTIPNGSSVQQAIQALESAVELGVPGSGSGVARSHVDIFTADGTATRFPLSVSPVYLDNLFVEVGGIIQVPGVNYTWDSDTNDLVITPAVSSGETIVARYLDALVIDTSQLGVARVQKFTSVLNQTDYVLDYDPIDLDEVEIAVGGIVQSPGDHYTLVLPNIIRFTPAPDPDLNILIRYGSHRTLDGGVGIAVTDRFTGDGVQTQFTLSENPGSLDNLLVIVDTVIQTPTDDYLWTSGRTLTFTTAPENDAVIVVRYGVVNTGGIPTANVKYDNFTSNGSTTVYTLSANPGSINNLHVTFTGLTQSPVSDYTFTAPYTLTLTEAPEAGTAIQVKIGGTLPIGVTQADLITTDVFTGSIIPNGSSVQQALQHLETGVEARVLTSAGSTSVTASSTTDQWASAKAVYDIVKVKATVIDIRDFFNGDMSYSSPYTTTTYVARQNTAVDIADAWIAANAYGDSLVQLTGRPAVVEIPSGLWTISKPVPLISGVSAKGAGKDIYNSATHIRKVGDFGTAFPGNVGNAPGTFITGCTFSDMRLYVDHGSPNGWGFTNPPEADFINKATSGAWFDLNYPRDLTLRSLSIWGQAYGIKIWGGAYCDFYDLDIHTIWDPLSTVRQEGISGIFLDGNLTQGIPSHFTFKDITIDGEKANTIVSYPGNNSKATVINQGAKDGFVIRCCEEIRINGLYIQGMSGSDLVFWTKPNVILQSVKVSNSGFDPCGTGPNDYGICFRDDGVSSATCVAISFSSCHILFQGNGYRGLGDTGCSAGKTSVAGLTWEAGEMSTFVGNAVYMNYATHMILSTSIRAFNLDNFYTSDDACGVYLGPDVGPCYISGTIGGNSIGGLTGHYCYDGVRYAGTNANLIHVNAANGGLIQDILVVNGKIMDRLLDDGSFAPMASVSQTYNIRTSPKTALFLDPLSADIAITLPTQGVPDGWQVQFIRAVSSTGSGTIVLNGAGSLTSPNTSIVLKYLDGVGWITVGKPVI